jgi:hypothetical protein
MGDLEPQPCQNFQSPWDLEPQPQAKLLLYEGPGAAAGPKFSISLGPRATTPSKIIFVRWTWSRSPAQIFNLPGASSHNPKPNYCCTGDLEPQPGPNFQSKLDLEPQPQAKLLLNGGPGAAARTKFSISLGPRATTPSQIIVVQWTWSRSRAKVFNHPGTWSLNPNPNYCCTVDLEPQTGQIFNLPGTWSLNPKPNYCCMRDLEPQPGINFQSPWYLEPQPQAKILLYWGPGAAAGPKFLITL